MGDMGDAFREHKEYMRERKAREGIDCPGCPKVRPKGYQPACCPGRRARSAGTAGRESGIATTQPKENHNVPGI